MLLIKNYYQLMSKIFVTGDFGYRGRTGSKIREGKGQELFSALDDVINSSDFSVINFETPVGDAKHFINKCGPRLCSDAIALKAIRQAGFSMVTLANNHFFDCGQYGVEKTIEACREYDIDFVGGGITYYDAVRPYEGKIAGDHISIVNVCETDFSIANENHGGAAPLDIVAVSRQILRLKVYSKVIVIVHGGHEYYQLPSTRMQQLYRFFIELGAYAVINHHQHCYSGYELYNGHPIFYGLGNFIFDSDTEKRDSVWNYGYAVQVDTTSPAYFKLFPYVQSNEEAGIRLMNDKEQAAFNENIAKLNSVISSPAELKKAETEYYGRMHTTSFLNPFYNGLTAKLYGMKRFPSFVSKKQRMYQLHYLQCESHRDIVINNLKRILDL